MSRSDSSRWWIGSEVVLGLTLVALPWCLGGAADVALPLLVSLAVLSLSLWLAGAVRHGRRASAHPVLLVPLVMALVTAMQLVPLPPALLSFASPPTAELREFALVPLGLTGWRPISVDVPSTSRALARAVCLLLVCFVALQLGRVPGARRRMFSVLAFTGLSVALTGFGHLLASADTLFGVHQFTANVRLVTPFGNINHLAAYLTLAGTVALGLALSADSRDVAAGWMAAAFGCGVAIFLSFSRGGILSFVITWGLVGAAFLALKGGGLRRVVPWVVIAATVAFAGVLAYEQLAARADTVSSLDKLHSTKIDLWPMLWSGVAPFGRLGMGAGAFELGFTRWQTEQLDVSFTHPENLPLQLAADLGVPVALGVMLVSLWLLRRMWIGVYAHHAERTVLLGVLGVVVHDLLDFSLELHALGPSVAIAVGLVASAQKNVRQTPSRLALAAVGLVAVGLVVAFVGIGTHRHVDAEAKLGELIRARAPVEDVRRNAVASVDVHPSDWVLYARVAGDLAVRGDPLDALAWSNRHAFLRPADPRAAVSAGQALLRLKQPSQALAQLKHAWELGDSLSIPLGLAVAKKEGLLDRVVVERPGVLQLLWKQATVQLGPADALSIVNAVEASGASPELVKTAQLLRVQHEADYGDASLALTQWEALSESERAGDDQQQLQVRLLTKLGRTDEAITALTGLVTRKPSELELTWKLVELLVAAGRSTDAHQALDRARPFVDGPNRATLFEREAALYVKEERWGRALESFQTASRITPARADLHYRMADVLERMGSLHSALDELRRGRVLDSPQGAQATDAQVERLERALVQ